MQCRTAAAALSILLLNACTPAARPFTDGAPQVLRVATFNIFAGNDLERRSSLDRLAALIDSLRIDVVLLQEVDRGTARSGGVDQPARLASLTGMHVVFGPSMNFDGGQFGNAILSRWPLMHTNVVVYDDSTDEGRAREPRSLLHAVIQTRAGPLHLVNTHFDHGADGARRQLQARQLRRYLAGAVPATAPLVAGGDLNGGPDDPAIAELAAVLEDSWIACGSGVGSTFRADAPDRRIDYIFLRDATCSAARVMPTTLSDHRPVIVDVHIN